MSHTILVVGGAGYIGSQTNLLLLEKGYRTIVLDNLTKGHREVVPAESTFISGDITKTTDLENIFENHKIDGIIHFAANIEVGESQIDPAKYYQNNVYGSLNLFQAALKYKVNNIVFSSTAATYGMPKTFPITEETITNPINTYGRSKLFVENILSDFHSAYGLKSVILRYFNACGADKFSRTGENHNPETHLIPIILQTASGDREFISIFGNDYPTKDGTCIRDYIHTMDLAEAHVLALDKMLSNKIEHDIFNLGTGTGFSNLEIINKAKEVTKLEIPTKFAAKRPGDPAILVADNAKAKSILNWQPRYSSLDFIIETAWNWHKILKQRSNKKIF